MAAIVNQTLSSSYGDAIEVPSGTKQIEVWAVDDKDAPTAMVAAWFEISDGTNLAPVLTSTTATYDKPIGLPSGVTGWSIRVKSPSAGDAVVMFT